MIELQHPEEYTSQLIEDIFNSISPENHKRIRKEMVNKVNEENKLNKHETDI